MTRWQVRAVSVVLMGQMCRSCRAVTPGRAPRASLTLRGSMASGTACSTMLRDSRKRPQVPQMIRPEITRLTRGSMKVQPVSQMTPPATTTPAETTASDSMCRKAPRMLMSPLRPEANRAAVAPLMAMPMAATTITVGPATGPGTTRRCRASVTTPPVTSNRVVALNRAASMEVDRRP